MGLAGLGLGHLLLVFLAHVVLLGHQGVVEGGVAQEAEAVVHVPLLGRGRGRSRGRGRGGAHLLLGRVWLHLVLALGLRYD